MSQGPEYPNPSGETPDPNQPPQQPNYGQPPPPQQPNYGQPVYQPPGAPVYGASPDTPYGVHPTLGIPYSDKSKIVAGLLQILIPLGIGRFYIGDTGIGVAQLLVTVFTCGIGALWPFIDGIIMLASDSKDVNGRLLRS